ncbi:hypothetical protein D3C84_184420 [compost metagenome]
MLWADGTWCWHGTPPTHARPGLSIEPPPGHRVPRAGRYRGQPRRLSGRAGTSRRSSAAGGPSVGPPSPVWPAPRPFVHGKIGLDVLMGHHRALVTQPESTVPACNRCIAVGRRRLTPGDVRRPAKLCRACRRVSSDYAACGLPLNYHQDGDFRIAWILHVRAE